MDQPPDFLYRFLRAGSSLAYLLNEIRGVLFCATSSQLNDPFDGLGLVPQEQAKVILNFPRGPSSFSIDKHWATACFSTKWNCAPMWAHYTDNNNGVCLVYDYPVLNQKAITGGAAFSSPLGEIRAKCHLERVRYYDELPAHFDDLKDALFAKTSDWKYECEWRLNY